MERNYASVNALQLYYEVHGEPRNSIPPLVLLHGGGSTIDTSFGAILPVLAKNRRVIAFDQQGHGHTADIADRPFSFRQSADDTVALLQHLKIDKADFFGFSNGGHITLQIAISHRRIVQKLIVESAMFSRDGCDPQFWNGFQDPKLENMPQELRDNYLRVAPEPANLQSFFDKSVERMRNFKGWTPAEIKMIQAPTLVLMGDRDVALPEHAVSLFRLLPNSQLCILPGTDHTTIVRSPLVPLIVETFLDK
jgi:pimeloyl-ACP methyl ester carboxylesterase